MPTLPAELPLSVSGLLEGEGISGALCFGGCLEKALAVLFERRTTALTDVVHQGRPETNDTGSPAMSDARINNTCRSHV